MDKKKCLVKDKDLYRSCFLSEAEELKKKYQAILTKEPDNLAYRMSLQTVEDHINSLKQKAQ